MKGRLTLVALVVSGMMASGCASVTETVVGSVRTDVRPFAEETINTLSADTLQIKRNNFTRLREYHDDDMVEFAELKQVVEAIERFRSSIAHYSLELVHITRLDVPDEEKSRLLSSYIAKEARDSIVGNLGMPGDEFDAIVANVAQQEKFLHAIQAVQPLVSSATTFHEELLQQITADKLPAVVDLLDSAIEQDYALLLEREDALERRRDDLLVAMAVLDRAMTGDTSAFAELRSAAAFRPSSARPPLKPGERDLIDAESYLIRELEKTAALFDLLQPSLAMHKEARAELKALNRLVQEGVKIARFQLAAWRKAHEDLGNGVKDPAKWLVTASSVAGRAL